MISNMIKYFEIGFPKFVHVKIQQEIISLSLLIWLFDI